MDYNPLAILSVAQLERRLTAAEVAVRCGAIGMAPPEWVRYLFHGPKQKEA